MDSDGRRPRRLLRQAANALSWSPDGRLLALYDDGWLYLATPQGELLHRLGIVLSPCELSPLAWSPDGRQLLLVLAEYPQGEACSAEPDFNAPPLIQIVDTDSGSVSTWMADAFDSAWSPDGEWIAFVSTRSGATELWAARRDGSDLHQLTYDGLWLRFPNWVK